MPNLQHSENLPGGDAADRDDTNTLDMSVEARARRLGWHPKEEFRGDPREFVDAGEFMRRSEEQLPVLRANFRKSEIRAARMERDVNQANQRLSAMETQLAEARDAVLSMRNMLSTAEERSYQRAIKEIETRMDAAIDDGDAAAAKKERANLTALTEEMAKRAAKTPAAKADQPAAQQQQANVDPVANAWVNDPDRDWYRGNARMKGYADGVFDELRRTNPGASMQQLLDKVQEEVEDQFPRHFERRRVDDDDRDPPRRQSRDRDRDDFDDRDPPRRQRADVQEPRPPRRQRSSGETFDDLPADAKQEFERTNRAIKAASGKEISKAEWAKEYFTPFTGNPLNN